MIKKVILFIVALALFPCTISYSQAWGFDIDFEAKTNQFASLNTCTHNSLYTTDPTDSTNGVYAIRRCTDEATAVQADGRIVQGYVAEPVEILMDFYLTGTADFRLELFQTTNGAAGGSVKNLVIVNFKKNGVYVGNTTKTATYSINKWYTLKCDVSADRNTWELYLSERGASTFASIGTFSTTGYTFDASYKELFYIRNNNTTFTYLDNIKGSLMYGNINGNTIAPINANGISGRTVIANSFGSDTSTIKYELNSTDNKTHNTRLITAYFDNNSYRLIGSEVMDVAITSTQQTFALTHDVSSYNNNYFVETYMWDSANGPYSAKKQKFDFNTSTSVIDTTAFYAGKNNCTINGACFKLLNTPFVRNGHLYVALDEVAYRLSISKTLLADAPNLITLYGKKYIATDYLAQITNKEYYFDRETGIGVLTNTGSPVGWNVSIDKLNNILETFAYDTYTAGDVFAMIDAKHPNNAHPRMFISSEKINDLQNARGAGDTTAIKLYSYVTNQASKYLKTTPNSYVKSDGLRLLNVSRSVLDRVAYLALAYQLTGNTAYADRAIAELDAAAAFPDWNAYHFLDVGEMSAAFGIGYDWLYDYIPDDKKATYRRAIADFGLSQIMDDYTDNASRKRTYKWSTATKANNWTFVCNGGCAISAIAIYGDDPTIDTLCGQVIENGLINVRRAIKLFAPHGSYVEGAGYWSYATMYYALYLSALEDATGSDLGLFNMPGVSKTVDFVESLNAPCGSYNFSDAGVSVNGVRPPSMLWFANKTGNASLGAPHMKLIQAGKTSPTWEDFIYYQPYTSYEADPTALDKYSDVAEVAVMRSGLDNNALYVGFHNGSNSESHAHRDVGGFILDFLGERFICELGSDDYNLTNYGNCYRLRAEGHNTLVINPSAEYDQLSSAVAPITSFESATNGAFAIADLTSAYKDANSVRRGIKLCNNRSAVLIRDELSLKAPSEVYWFAHSQGEIYVVDEKSATITKNGKTIELLLLSDGEFVKMDAKPLPTSPTVDGQATNDEYKKLAIHLTSFQSGSIVVGIREFGSGYTFDTTTTLNNWSN